MTPEKARDELVDLATVILEADNIAAADAIIRALLANPDVVLRALGAVPSSPNNGIEWQNYWYVPESKP